MAIIYVLSDQPGLSTGLSWDTAIRKLAHMGVFGLLWYLWWRALDRRGLLWPVAITLTYAISDELHQHFVPDRNGSPFDVLIDCAGMAIAIALTLRTAQHRTQTGAPINADATAPTQPGHESVRS